MTLACVSDSPSIHPDGPKRQERASLPVRYRKAGISQFSPDSGPAEAAIVKYADDFLEYQKAGESLILTGPAGTGKTHAAAAIINRATMIHGISARFCTAIELVREIRNTWGQKAAESESVVVSRLTNTRLLVIDDVGAQQGSENEKVLLFDVLTTRYNNKLPTIITTNLNRQELEQFLGDRIVDRLSEGRGGLLVMRGPSRRTS